MQMREEIVLLRARNARLRQGLQRVKQEIRHALDTTIKVIGDLTDDHPHRLRPLKTEKIYADERKTLRGL